MLLVAVVRIYKCLCVSIVNTQVCWAGRGTSRCIPRKGHLSFWLVPKQTTLSFHHRSLHIDSIATLGSMATTRSVVRVQWGLSVRACCVSNSPNVLFFMLNPPGWLIRFNLHVHMTWLWSIHSTLMFNFVDVGKSNTKLLSPRRFYTKKSITSQDKRNGAIMEQSNALFTFPPPRCRSICIITHSHLHIASHSSIPTALCQNPSWKDNIVQSTLYNTWPQWYS